MKGLMVAALLTAALQALPWASVQDIPDAHIVASSIHHCQQGKILAIALHDPATGYWMLWMTSRAWAMAPFGLTEPAEGTISKKIIQGVFREVGEKQTFVAVKVIVPPQDPEERTAVFCGWLYPVDA